MVKKGTPARVEPAGSFLPVVPEEEQQDPGEAAGSAAANPSATSQVEGAEAAGSAAARPPRGREGRGRAGKSVNRKEDRKVYYEAQERSPRPVPAVLGSSPDTPNQVRRRDSGVLRRVAGLLQLALLLWSLRISGGG